MNLGRAAVAAAVAGVLLAGCRTTEQESAQIQKRLGHQSADATVTRLVGTDPSVRIAKSALVTGAGGTAAVLELTNTSAKAQTDVPILITVSDAAGKTVYTNDTAGASSPSGELSLLPAHASAWWVDANVLASGGTPAALVARIGSAAARPMSSVALTTRALKVGSNFIGPLVEGKVVNGSSTAQTQLAIYAVALSGGHVVAAGEGALPSLGAHAAATFQVTVVGKAKGATAAVTVAPAHLG